MKIAIGIIMIIACLVFGIGGLWIIAVGGDAVGGFIMAV